MESKELVKIIVDALEDKKAEDLTVIDISNLSVIADYFIIAGGGSRNQLHALSDNVGEMCAKAGVHAKNTEGYDSASWILMDFHDVIVHIFSAEDRKFYDLERIWRDGKVIDPSEL